MRLSCLVLQVVLLLVNNRKFEKKVKRLGEHFSQPLLNEYFYYRTPTLLAAAAHRPKCLIALEVDTRLKINKLPCLTAYAIPSKAV